MPTSKTVTVLTAAKITELVTKFPGLGEDTFVHERDYNQAENGRVARADQIERLQGELDAANQHVKILSEARDRLAHETTAVTPHGFKTVVQCEGCGVHYVPGARHWSQCPTHPGEWVQVTPVEPSGLAAQIEDAQRRIAAWPDDVRIALGLPEKATAPTWDCACNDPTCAYCGPRLASQHSEAPKP